MFCARGCAPRCGHFRIACNNSRAVVVTSPMSDAWEDSMFITIMRLCAAAACVAVPAVAQAVSLKVVTVTAPDVNCVFDPSCKLTVTDTIGDIVIPALSGKAVLQSRTFSGAAGAPGAGLTGYEYRVDLTQASTANDAACVTDLTVDFGPLVQLQYDKAGPNDDVYVINKGGLGTVGLFSADMTDNKITFVFDQPVCAAAEGAKGATSFFFGLAAKGAPTAVTASMGVPGSNPVDVKARAPSH